MLRSMCVIWRTDMKYALQIFQLDVTKYKVWTIVLKCFIFVSSWEPAFRWIVAILNEGLKTIDILLKLLGKCYVPMYNHSAIHRHLLSLSVVFWWSTRFLIGECSAGVWSSEIAGSAVVVDHFYKVGKLFLVFLACLPCKGNSQEHMSDAHSIWTYSLPIRMPSMFVLIGLGSFPIQMFFSFFHLSG